MLKLKVLQLKWLYLNNSFHLKLKINKRIKILIRFKNIANKTIEKDNIK